MIITAICVTINMNISVNSMLGLILSILRIQCRNRSVTFRLIRSVRFRYACFINDINLRIATGRALVITLYFTSDMCTVSEIFPNTGILNIIDKDIIVFLSHPIAVNIGQSFAAVSAGTSVNVLTFVDSRIVNVSVTARLPSVRVEVLVFTDFLNFDITALRTGVAIPKVLFGDPFAVDIRQRFAAVDSGIGVNILTFMDSRIVNISEIRIFQSSGVLVQVFADFLNFDITALRTGVAIPKVFFGDPFAVDIRQRFAAVGAGVRVDILTFVDIGIVNISVAARLPSVVGVVFVCATFGFFREI